jgi:hypothetical protein
VSISVCTDNHYPLADAPRRCLHVFNIPFANGIGRIDQERDSLRLWREFAQQFKALWYQRAGVKATPVALPPGRFILATKPTFTGWAPFANTIGNC